MSVLGCRGWDPDRRDWIRARPELDGRLLQPSNQLPTEPNLVDMFPHSDRIVDLASVDRAGADVPQLYLTDAAGEKRQRLLGFQRVELQPGQSQQLSLTADPRLLARFDGNTDQWRIAAGTYTIAVGKNAEDLVLEKEASLSGRQFGP